MDRRQIKTRNAIFQAFTELLARRRYAQITVQQIIDAANIGRSTFYSHFPTKEALMDALLTELFGHVFAGVGVHCPIPEFTPQGNGYRAYTTHILYHISNQREAFMRLLRSDSRDIFLRYLKEHLKLQLGEYWLNHEEGERPAVPADFLRNHFACTFVETIHWWIESDMRQTPEEIAGYFTAVMDPLLGR